MDASVEATERRSIIAYDKRIYYRPQLEPFCDPEWEEAERSGEEPQYYLQAGGCGIIYRKYKPAVAKLVMQRTGIILTPWKGEKMPRYIDADYLDELITQLNHEGRGITRNEYKMIDSILFEFPTADVVERKVGEWIVIMDEPTITFDECKCSECGVVEYFNKGWKKFNYCPNCGARMKGESDEHTRTDCKSAV